MGRSGDSFSKKEKEKKKRKKAEAKRRRREERKENNDKGGSFDDMIAYVDQYGNIVDEPPDPKDKEVIDAEDIIIGIPPKEEIEMETSGTGRLDYFNDAKGFGFIIGDAYGDKFFVHVSNMLDDIRVGDKVSFEIEDSPRGPNAVEVKKV